MTVMTGPHLRHCHVYDGLGCACGQDDSVMNAISMIDRVLGIPSAAWIVREKERSMYARMSALGLLPHEMGGIATKGCGRCGGTMKRTEDRDGSKQWVCSNVKCGAVE